MIALLKQKNKVSIQQKPRKSYDAKDVFKKKKIDELDMSNVSVRQNQQSVNQSSLSSNRK